MAKRRTIGIIPQNVMKKDTKDQDLSILEGLLREEFVLIIGCETILSRNNSSTQGTGDIMFQIYNKIADEHGIPVDNRPLTDHEWQVLLSKQKINSQSLCTKAWKSIRSSSDLEIEDSLDIFLMGLRKLNIYPTIFTTCIDDTVEKWITDESFYGDCLEVYNFKKEGDIRRFNQDIKEQKKMNRIGPAKLVYLFGKIGDRNTLGHSIDYVFSENEALESISEYIKSEKPGLNEMMTTYFYHKKILSIGCHFDDWRFRFFWYAFRNGVPQLKEGAVAYTCDKPDSLSEYLQHNEVIVELDSRAFMKRLSDLMHEDDIKTKVLANRVATSNGVFISYASEDFTQAYQLYWYLTENGIKVWMDYSDLHSGDQYNKIIQESIQKCGVFLPILSDAVKRTLENNENERYFIKEWQLANGRTILPVYAGTYSIREPYHKLFTDYVGITDDNDITIESIGKKETLKKALIDKLSIFNQ